MSRRCSQETSSQMFNDVATEPDSKISSTSSKPAQSHNHLYIELGTPTIVGKVMMDQGHYYQLSSLVQDLLNVNDLGETKSTISNGNCFFDSFIGYNDQIKSVTHRNNVVEALRARLYKLARKNLNKNLKVSDEVVDIRKTTKTTLIKIKEWISKYYDDIKSTLTFDKDFHKGSDLLEFSSNKFSDLSDKLLVELYTHTMGENRGRFTWPDYDILCKCEVFDCIIIMIYMGELSNSIQIYYPPGSNFDRNWLSKIEHFKIIVKNGSHFEYVSPSKSFEMRIEAISHCLVSRINDVISLDNDNEDNVNESNTPVIKKKPLIEEHERERETKNESSQANKTKSSKKETSKSKDHAKYEEMNNILQAGNCDLLLRFDGACLKGKAKKCGSGAVLYIVLNNVQKQIWYGYGPSEWDKTNGEDVNVMIAMYNALIIGLEFISSNILIIRSLSIECESQILISHISNGYWGQDFKTLYDNVKNLMSKIKCVDSMVFNTINRNENWKADFMAQQGARSDKPFIMEYLKFIDNDSKDGSRVSSRKSKPSSKKRALMDDSSTADFEAYAISKDSKLLDKHETIIDNMHDEYLIDVPTIKENKHISDVSILQQLFDIDDVIDGTYLKVIEELDDEEIFSRFISKKSLKLYRKDKLSREILLIMNNIVSTLFVKISDASNCLSDHLALFLLPSVVKLLILGIRHKTIVSSIEIVLRNVLSFLYTSESSSLIIVKLFEILYKDDVPRGNINVYHCSHKGLYQKVKLLTEECQYGRAFKLLKQSKGGNGIPSVADDELDGEVRKYFPAENSYITGDVFGEGLLNSDNVQDLDISFEDVLKCVKSLNISSAPGVDAWSYNFLKNLILFGYNKEESLSQIIDTIILAVNRFYKAGFCNKSRQLWSTTRLVFIPKDGVGLRPIGITSALYRLFGKIISFKVKERVSTILCLNNQLGIGVPDGCSIGATLINRYLHVNNKEDNSREKAILQNDISNAFNETSHSLIEEGLQLICPDLIHVFRFIYSNNPILICNHREVGRLFTGTLQGDALSMIFFNVAFHVVLSKIKNALPTISLVAYCDDLTVLTHKDCIETDSLCIWEMMEQHGFRVNKNKCKIVSVNDDTTILGMPIGSQEFVNDSFKVLVEDMQSKVSLIDTKCIKSKSRLIFLKDCINTIPTYFIRLISLNQTQYDEIDSVIDEGIKHIVGRSIVNGYSHFIRGLSQHLGGLGIHRYGTGFGQILHDILQIRTNQFIEEHDLGDVIPITLNRTLSLNLLGLEDDSDLSNSSTRHQRILKNVVNSLMDTFHSDKYLVANAALLLSSSFKGSAYHITGYRGFNFRLDSHYVHALSNVLLLPICDNHLEVDCFCHGNALMGNRVGYKSADFNRHNKSHQCLFPLSHMFSCQAFNGYKIRCHDLCVKAIMSYIKSINRNAVIEHEPRKVKMVQSSQNTREDLKITFKDNDKWKIALDVSIVNPAQFVAIEPTLSKVLSREEKNDSMTISDIRGVESACSKKFYHTRMAEAAKRNHHIDNLTPGFSFQPFIIDHTGNLGPQATEFISFINKISGIKGADGAAGAGKKMDYSKEVFLRRRILFFCNLKCAIARENALSQLKPSKIVGECREFE